MLLGAGHRLMRRALRTKAETVLGECGIPILLQDLKQRLLDETVENGWDAKLSHPTTRFGYLYALHRLRLIGPTKKLVAFFLPVLLQVARQLPNAHPVNAGAPLIGLDSP